MIYGGIIKPLFDRCFSLVLIAITSPLLLVLFVASGVVYGKPLFLQERSGKNCSPFFMFKFTSMRANRALPEAGRITAYGRFIRKYSLDELPQLFNILAGQMSFVGPRPLPAQYAEKMEGTQRRRFGVKPGLTGLVQVSGRNSLTWDEKFELDTKYVATISAVVDAHILLKTVPVCISGAGTSHPGYATMPVFEPKRKEVPI